MPAPLWVYLPTPHRYGFWGGAQWGSFKRVQGGPIASMQSRRAPFDEPLIALVSRQGAKAEALAGAALPPLAQRRDAAAYGQRPQSLCDCRWPRRYLPPPGRTCIWDTAAAQAILQGAGGELFQPGRQTLKL